jgi:hypothetical protein
MTANPASHEPLPAASGEAEKHNSRLVTHSGCTSMRRFMAESKSCWQVQAQKTATWDSWCGAECGRVKHPAPCFSDHDSRRRKLSRSDAFLCMSQGGLHIKLWLSLLTAKIHQRADYRKVRETIKILVKIIDLAHVNRQVI